MNSNKNEQELNEILDSDYFTEWLTTLLSESYPTTITFTKKDGTTRVMKCTRNMDNIPEDKRPSGTMENASNKVIKAFDLDKQEWRSFSQTSVKRIEFSIE
jgi:hypothetical protein